jgi:tetratricopeptide (TPR) repeat protein
MVASALLVVLLTQSAPAPDARAVQTYLRAASGLYQTLEYERALEQLKRARTVSSGVSDDAVIARYEGIVLFDMGQREEAVAAFKEALYLEPDATLPLRVSPKIADAFEATRLKVKKELAPLLAKRQAEDQARLEAQRAHAAREAVAAKDAQAARDAAARAEAERRAALPAAPTPAPVEPAASAAPKKVPLTPLVLGAGALVAAATATVFGVLAEQQIGLARSASFQVDTVMALERAQLPATVANIAWAVAGAAAVAALIAWLAGAP